MPTTFIRMLQTVDVSGITLEQDKLVSIEIYKDYDVLSEGWHESLIASNQAVLLTEYPAPQFKPNDSLRDNFSSRRMLVMTDTTKGNSAQHQEIAELPEIVFDLTRFNIEDNGETTQYAFQAKFPLDENGDIDVPANIRSLEARGLQIMTLAEFREYAKSNKFDRELPPQADIKVKARGGDISGKELANHRKNKAKGRR